MRVTSSTNKLPGSSTRLLMQSWQKLALGFARRHTLDWVAPQLHKVHQPEGSAQVGSVEEDHSPSRHGAAAEFRPVSFAKPQVLITEATGLLLPSLGKMLSLRPIQELESRREAELQQGARRHAAG